MSKITVSYTRPNTSVVWPFDLPWLTAEEKDAFLSYRQVTFVDSGKAVGPAITYSDDDLSATVEWVFDNSTSVVEWLEDTTLDDIIAQRGNYIAENNCTYSVDVVY